MKNVCIFAICVLLFLFSAASAPPAFAQAASAPIIGLAVVQNGIRFETWLTSPKIVIPNKDVLYEKRMPMVLSARVTNLTTMPVHFNSFCLYPTLIKPSGKELVPDPILIAGYFRPAQEADYLLLQPGQSVILPYVSSLYWQQNRLCFTWGYHSFDDHPEVYEGMSAGVYRFHLHHRNPSSTVVIRRQAFGKPVKTLTGFWTGDVTLPPLMLHLVNLSN